MLNKKTFILIVSAAFLISGCFSIPGKVNFDPNLPRERTATVVFSYEIIVHQYNRVDVYNNWYPAGSNRKNTATLPAGPAEIKLNIHTIRNAGYNRSAFIEVDNILLNFDFEAGKKYFVGIHLEYTESNIIRRRGIFGIGVWSGSNDKGGKETALRFWELGEI